MKTMNGHINKRIIPLLLAIAIGAQPINGTVDTEKVEDLYLKDGLSTKDPSNSEKILNYMIRNGEYFLGAGIGLMMVAISARAQKKNLVSHSIKPVNVTDVTLKDYIGIPPAVNILVDQIKNREAYKVVKAPFTKGILLTGNPGTGKSFLARAIAGETQCPFFNVSATEFSQTYIGASEMMIRELFTNAKLAAVKAPSKVAIIFIDELDAIGSRGRSSREGNSIGIVETLLTEMDGFNQISVEDLQFPWYKRLSFKLQGLKLPEISLVVFGATNVPEVIDAALKRPGRFDNIIEVGNPDAVAREKIIELYFKKYPCADDVEAERLAVATEGMTPASIKALFEEASRDAGFERQSVIEIKNFCRAFFGIVDVKKTDEYKQKLVEEMLIAMYPCDNTVTVNTIAGKLRYANAQELADVFENAYKKIATEQTVPGGGAVTTGERFISLSDLINAK
jgi:cell division protease FtsH